LILKLARLATTPWNNHNASAAEGRDELASLGHFDDARVVHFSLSCTCRLEDLKRWRSCPRCASGGVVGVDTEMQRDLEKGWWQSGKGIMTKAMQNRTYGSPIYARRVRPV